MEVLRPDGGNGKFVLQESLSFSIVEMKTLLLTVILPCTSARGGVTKAFNLKVKKGKMSTHKGDIKKALRLSKGR